MWIYKYVIAATLGFVALPASAGFISHLSSSDWLAAGDGLITRDSSTGLDWLDLTQTTGNSILDTEAEAFYTSGEFRWATNLQINTLMSHITGVAFDAGGPLYVQTVRPESYADGTSFINYLGATGVGPTGRYTQGVSRGSPGTGVGTFGLGFVQTVVEPFSYAPMLLSGSPDYDCCWLQTSRSSQVGSWLVRGATVPAPATIALFGLGLAALGISRRKRNAHR